MIVKLDHFKRGRGENKIFETHLVIEVFFLGFYSGGLYVDVGPV